MNDFFRAARSICNPLASPPNWPVNPPDYYDTEPEMRRRFLDARVVEIYKDPEELAEALGMYLEQNPAQFAETLKKAAGGTLVAAIELDDLITQAIVMMAEKEWGKRGE